MAATASSSASEGAAWPSRRSTASSSRRGTAVGASTDRGVAASAEEEEEKDDADANEGASLRERDVFFLPPPHDRFGDGIESFLANEGTESFILAEARDWEGE
jgi:hypothetical protein